MNDKRRDDVLAMFSESHLGLPSPDVKHAKRSFDSRRPDCACRLTRRHCRLALQRQFFDSFVAASQRVGTGLTVFHQNNGSR